MDIFTGCTCDYCRSVMLAAELDVFQMRVIFACPNNCAPRKVIDGPFKIIPAPQFLAIMQAFNPKASYRSVCWNCRQMIESDYCQRDPIPTLGFVCRNCGQSLWGLLKKKGLIKEIPPLLTATQ